MKVALLLSGGMDSVAIAYWKRPEIAITVDYGQLAAPAEIRAAAAVSEILGIEHHVVSANVRALGSGDMAGESSSSFAPIPEWWPFRNQLLLTLAGMKVISLSVGRILIGSVVTDAQHSDGNLEFVAAIDALLRMQEGGIAVEAPAIAYTSAELIKASNVPEEVLAWSHSCHVSDFACGVCRGCRKHYETLKELGFEPY
jgi:7-cyano-7-deazaguanine synthase